MTNCTHLQNTKFSRVILNKLWLYEVINTVVIFLKSNEQAGNNLQQNTTFLVQGKYLELHTWYPYENSNRCNPAEGTVRVKVFTVRNLSDIKKSDIFRGYIDKNFHGCPFKVYVRTMFPLVYPPKLVRYNDSYSRTVYEEGMEIEMLKLIGNSLNMTLNIANFEEVLGIIIAAGDTDVEEIKGQPFIFVGWTPAVIFQMDNFLEYTHSYFSSRSAWYTLCAVKYQRWNRFFSIFSVDMWICSAFSLTLAIITVRCISNYAHKSHLHESNSYSNIFSVTTNIIAVPLSVSVNTQPRSAPLRLFFFCWVCYSVAISTVFLAYLTTFVIEPGYEEPIRTVEEMLKSEKMWGIDRQYYVLFNNTSDPVESAIIKDAVLCPDEATCFIWAAVYHNISAPLRDLDVDIYRSRGEWTDENNRPLLCEMDGRVAKTIRFAIMVGKGVPFFEFMDDVLSHIIEGGIFMYIEKRSFDKLKIESKLDVHTFDDTYYAINIIHLQTAFYFLVLGYVLAVVCFVSEIMWYCYRSKGRGLTGTSVTDRHK
jgi:hypothetical protein